MKKMLMLTAGLAVLACSAKLPTDSPILVEANQIHLEAEAIRERIEPEIEKIDSLKNLLLVKKTPKTDLLAKNLLSIKLDFENWEKNFFFVPGFEQAGHAHQHDHTPAPELPADKMLEVQKEIKTDIERIQTKLNKVLTEILEISEQ